MISLGDLFVFVAVLVIVSVFLKVLHSFIGGALRDPPAEAHRQPYQNAHAKASQSGKPEGITASQ
jgi:hypothetical protein